jgi:hypothetical protein
MNFFGKYLGEGMSQKKEGMMKIMPSSFVNFFGSSGLKKAAI